MGVWLLGRFANPSRWNRSLGAALQCSQELVGRPVSSSHFAPGLVLRPALHWVWNANGCFSLSKMEGSRVAVLGFCTCGLIGVMDWAQRVYVYCAEFGCLSFSDNFLSPPLGMSGVQTLIILRTWDYLELEGWTLSQGSLRELALNFKIKVIEKLGWNFQRIIGSFNLELTRYAK